MINVFPNEEPKVEVIPQMQINSLTLDRNSTLVVRVSRESGYDYEELQEIYKSFKDRFPLHQIFVWYDDIDFMVINDNAYKPERITELNHDENYSQNYY